MKTVVSVSLGSSKRDHQAQLTILGEEISMSRRGVDGQFKQAVALLADAIARLDAMTDGQRRALGAAGRQRLLSHFTLAAQARALSAMVEAA